MSCHRPALGILSLGLLLGCGSPGDGPNRDDREKRLLLAPGSSPGPNPDDVLVVPAPRTDGAEDQAPRFNEGGSPLKDLPRSDGALRTVELTIAVGAEGRPAEAPVVLLGFRGVDITAKGALKPGRRPQWFWSSPLIPIEGDRVSVEAPLPGGLAMFALLDLDGDLAPGPGEYMSAIVRDFAPPPEGEAAVFALDRRFGMD